jgi:hypothetical protein
MSSAAARAFPLKDSDIENTQSLANKFPVAVEAPPTIEFPNRFHCKSAVAGLSLVKWTRALRYRCR